MKLASVLVDGVATYGVVDGASFIDAGSVLRARLPDLASVIAAGAYEDMAVDAPLLRLSSVRFLPVIPRPEKILCVGLNYEMHRQETGRDESAYPTIFTRFFNTQTGHNEPLLRPALSAKFDFEGELAIIIGRPAWRVTEADALAHIAGFACYNDGSVRDWQQHTTQFTPGKNFPATGGFGPWMVTPDAFGPIGAQRITTRLNGETVQDAHLSEMIFSIPRIIAYCSSFTRLEPGDVIATGTPGGVGARRKPPLWMKPGDLVEVEIDGIGTLANPVTAET